MAVDKNLFLYDLAVVAIMKNEGPYLKEWLDYHLLAGVDHFYIYDNESTDNTKEVLQPYIDKEIVTYIFYPGKFRQFSVYNDAIVNYKFFCRYMAFIDGDEFIVPRNDKSIVEIVDEVLLNNPGVAALGINWYMFGSNFQEKADYSRGVLERFTRREANVNKHVKSIMNPRKVDYFFNSHFAVYYYGLNGVNEENEIIPHAFDERDEIKQIAVHHYHTKSEEEYKKRYMLGKPGSTVEENSGEDYFESFKMHDFNETFDSTAWKYFISRKKNLGEGDVLELIAPSKKVDWDRVFSAIMINLSPMFSKYVPQNYFVNNMETFLICRTMSSYLSGRKINEPMSEFLEELSLTGAYNTLFTNIMVDDVFLLINDLPNILSLKYPIVTKIRTGCIRTIEKLREHMRSPEVRIWRDSTYLEYIAKMLELIP